MAYTGASSVLVTLTLFVHLNNSESRELWLEYHYGAMNGWWGAEGGEDWHTNWQGPVHWVNSDGPLVRLFWIRADMTIHCHVKRVKNSVKETGATGTIELQIDVFNLTSSLHHLFSSHFSESVMPRFLFPLWCRPDIICYLTKVWAQPIGTRRLSKHVRIITDSNSNMDSHTRGLFIVIMNENCERFTSL